MKKKPGVGVAQVSGIVSESVLKQLKVKYLTEHGFRKDAASWTNGIKRVRSSLVEDSEIPLSVLINIIGKSAPKTKKPIAIAKKQPCPSMKLNKPKKAAKRTRSTEYKDALDYRLPGSFGTGKRR
jgi:hypothetical protein